MHRSILIELHPGVCEYKPNTYISLAPNTDQSIVFKSIYMSLTSMTWFYDYKNERKTEKKKKEEKINYSNTSRMKFKQVNY